MDSLQDVLDLDTEEAEIDIEASLEELFSFFDQFVEDRPYLSDEFKVHSLGQIWRGRIEVQFYCTHEGQASGLASGFYPLQSDLDGQTHELYLFNCSAIDAIGQYLATH